MLVFGKTRTPVITYLCDWFMLVGAQSGSSDGPQQSTGSSDGTKPADQSSQQPSQSIPSSMPMPPFMPGMPMPSMPGFPPGMFPPMMGMRPPPGMPGLLTRYYLWYGCAINIALAYMAFVINTFSARGVLTRPKIRYHTVLTCPM